MTSRFRLLSPVVLVLLLSGYTFAQHVPDIKYPSPQVYTVRTPIPDLSPFNSGGEIKPLGNKDEVTTIASGMNFPNGVTIGRNGELFVAENAGQKILKVDAAGRVSTFAGQSTSGHENGKGTEARFFDPMFILLDADDNLIVADYSNNQIRKITPDGDVTLLAGRPDAWYGKKDGTGTDAEFQLPYWMAMDAVGNIFISDGGNNTIRKMTPGAVVTTFAGSGAVGSGNGPALDATFYGICGLAFDKAGNLFTCDINNHLIRKITPEGQVSTYAGTGVPGNTNGDRLSASFNNPIGIAIDPADNIYITDMLNQQIRKISPEGVVSTIAGTGQKGAADGPAASASFNFPGGIAVDGAGNIFIVDMHNGKIRLFGTGGYTIDKALPPGLTFDSKTGTVKGTPTEVWPETTYTVTGYNGAGSSVTTLVISVEDDLNAAKGISGIPNVFSPNGDGSNDVWKISDGPLPGYRVRVFNRTGVPVFQSYGYSIPWDGTCKGEVLPVGVYYYTITTDAGRKYISGTVTILR